MKNNTPTISAQQVVNCAAAGVKLLNLPSTMVPGDMRQDMAVLEAVLSSIASGKMVLVNPPVPALESAIDKQPGPDNATE